MTVMKNKYLVYGFMAGFFCLNVFAAEDTASESAGGAPDTTEASTDTRSEAARAAQEFLEKMRRQRGLIVDDQQSSSVDDAAEALRKKEDDIDNEKNLEEVLNASGNDYSLVKQGDFDVLYAFGYSYFDDDSIDVAFDSTGSTLTKFLVLQNALTTFSHTFTLDYGWKDNINIGFSLPILTRRDALRDQDLTAWGDIDARVRWQPWPVRVGELTKTVFTSFSIPSGRSPYKIDFDDELSSGSGVFSLGGGINVSKVIDPVVLFGSASMDWNFDASGLDQLRGGGQVLESVEPGMSMSFNAGMIYSLSYEVSLSFQYQQSFNFETTYTFNNGKAVAAENTASTFVFGTGWRLKPDMILSLGIGIGLTRNAQDVSISASIPINYTGLGDWFPF